MSTPNATNLLSPPALGGLAPSRLPRARWLRQPHVTRRAGAARVSVQQAVEAALATERERLAADLHDDVGAALSTLAQCSADPGLAKLARGALADLRANLRSLTGSTRPLAEHLAEWRMECATRCEAAHTAFFWAVSASSLESLLAPLVAEQARRILREGLSNALRHAVGGPVAIHIRADGQTLALTVTDSGAGSIAAPLGISLGLGLPSLQRRAEALGGSCSLSPRTDGQAGHQLQAQLPLS
jgi:two-component system, NarL family, sensor histidine kinase UhpB